MNREGLIEKVLQEGERRADEVEAFCIRGRSVSAGIKKGILGTAEESESWSMTIRTIKDGRIGFSSTGDPDRWMECLDAALASGRIATAQEWGGLPVPDVAMFSAPSADLDLAVDIGNAAGMVEDLLAGAAEHPVDIIGGGVDLGRSHRELANTNGVAYSMERTIAAASLEAIREQSTGYEFDASPFLADIDPRAVGEAAASLAYRSLGGDRVDTGRYDVILSPIAAASLIGNILIPA
ncbi:MAG: TldD/PmbA family protein, partial [Methanomicrobiales archaeon]|nr:TldD/PmbA family protein [Methanomicrobiales archaeon]